MIYDYRGEMVAKYPSLVGDGVTDDTNALQALVNTYSSIILPPDLTLKITNTIVINTAICSAFDGCGSKILVSGNFPAFRIDGTLTSDMTANPNTLRPAIMNDEGGFILSNCKIQGNGNGTGIVLDGCFKPSIKGCYLHGLNDGIVIKNQCRDVVIVENHIYSCLNDGIKIDSSANIHQCNINDNIINYATNCIHFDKPVYTANFQIVGNDIEISSYPTETMAVARCILIDCDTSDTSIITNIQEIEIVGNTIQGHSKSDAIIEFTGGAAKTRHITEVSITGNHISNSTKNLIVIENVSNLCISGNTMMSAFEHCISIKDNNTIISITDNNCNNCGGFVKVLESVTRLIIMGNLSDTSTADPYDLEGPSITNAIVSNNIVSGASTGMVVNPTKATRCVVSNNIVGSGNYTLSQSVTAHDNV